MQTTISYDNRLVVQFYKWLINSWKYSEEKSTNNNNRKDRNKPHLITSWLVS